MSIYSVSCGLKTNKPSSVPWRPLRQLTCCDRKRNEPSSVTWRPLSQLTRSSLKRTCIDTRQPGSVYKKLDTRQSEILTSFLEIARLIPLRT